MKNTAVAAADANRDFSKLLRAVKEGRSYTITSHGRPVARLVPIDADAERREAAKARLLKRLRTQKGVSIGSWTRDELHDRQ